MSPFDPAWEAAHAARAWGQYPREDLIRFVARNYYDAPHRSGVHFLDLGCGAGAATWYLLREGFSVTAMDGSLSAMNRLADRISLNEAARATLMLQDLTLLQPTSQPQGYYDCILDICTSQHMEDKDQTALIENALRWLKPGGRIFSVLASTGSDISFHATDTGISMIGYTGITDLFKSFYDLNIDRLDRRVDGRTWAEWIVIATKSHNRQEPFGLALTY